MKVRKFTKQEDRDILDCLVMECHSFKRNRAEMLIRAERNDYDFDNGDHGKYLLACIARMEALITKFDGEVPQIDDLYMAHIRRAVEMEDTSGLRIY